MGEAQTRTTTRGAAPPVSLASLEAQAASLAFNDEQLAGRVRVLEKMLDTRSTPLWKRVVFRLDGWPAWTVVAREPAWRPWRKWWRS